VGPRSMILIATRPVNGVLARCFPFPGRAVPIILQAHDGTGWRQEVLGECRKKTPAARRERKSEIAAGVQMLLWVISPIWYNSHWFHYTTSVVQSNASFSEKSR
jgi:hypothetical protein